jgi:transcriptional regulator with XRE-family HTH domain
MKNITGRSRSKARLPTYVDTHVGARVRERRVQLGMSQTDLAVACGITFQQIQKYENGANRVSASRLWQFAAILGIPADNFFEGLARHKIPAAVAKSLDAERRGNLERSEDAKIDPETLRLARSIASLSDEKLKLRLKTMLSALSAA